MPETAATRFLGGSYRPYSHGSGGSELALAIAAAVAAKLHDHHDRIDDAADALVDNDGAVAMDALVQPVTDAIAAGASFAEVSQLLDDLTAALDEEQLEQLLEHGCIVSRAAGVSGL